MVDLIPRASDDVVGLAICIGAVAVCGLIMHFSHYVGRMTGHIRIDSASRPAVHPLKHVQPLPSTKPTIHDRAA